MGLNADKPMSKAGRKIRVKSSSTRRKITLWCWLFMVPNLILYAMFLGWPIVSSWFYAFHTWTGIGNSMTFVGIKNFSDLLHDSSYITAFEHTFIFMLGVVPIQLIVALLLALVLNRPSLKFSSFYRTIYFIPVVTTAAIVGIIMVYIWGSGGPVDFVLLKLGIIHRSINFLGNVKWAMFTAIIIFAWKNIGINMIYWLAALQSVPDELYEAAKIDGSNGWNTLIRITIPLITPIGVVILLLDIAGALKVFDLIKTLTNGGPFFATDVVSTFIYRYAFSSEMGMPRMGYATAAGIFFGFAVILIMILSHFLNRRMQKLMKV